MHDWFTSRYEPMVKGYTSDRFDHILLYYFIILGLIKLNSP